MTRSALLLLFTLCAVSAAPSFQELKTSNLPFKFGLCKFPPVSSGLKGNDFFTNKWYVWKNAGNLFFDRSGSCAGMDTRITGNEIELLIFQYEPLLESYVTIRGETEADYVRFEGLVFPVNYNLFGKYNFSMTFSVVETDYDNWAAVYFCRQLLGFKLEMSWLMTRNSDNHVSEQLQEDMSKAVSKVGYSLDDFHLQDNSVCGNGEPHL